MRPIDADALYETISRWLGDVNYDFETRNALRCALYEIKTAPTAEKKGKWEETNWHTEWYGTEKKCSVCGESMLLTDFRNYCPNCGARMEE